MDLVVQQSREGQVWLDHEIRSSVHSSCMSTIDIILWYLLVSPGTCSVLLGRK